MVFSVCINCYHNFYHKCCKDERVISRDGYRDNYTCDICEKISWTEYIVDIDLDKTIEHLKETDKRIKEIEARHQKLIDLLIDSMTIEGLEELKN